MIKSKFALSLFLPLALAAGCNESDDAGKPNQQPATRPTEPAAAANRRVYELTLAPVNSSGVTGQGRFVIDGGSIGAYIEATGLAPGRRHMQHIHSGKRCADTSADTNHDGFIDMAEAEAVAGSPIVPLVVVQNLNRPGLTPPSMDLNLYPMASQGGLLTYIQSVQFGNALGQPGVGQPGQPGIARPGQPAVTPSGSPSPEPSVSPSASPDPGMPGTPGTAQIPDLDQLVVEIHGIDPNTSLPSTVAGREGLSASDTVPVACGVLTRVDE